MNALLDASAEVRICRDRHAAGQAPVPAVKAFAGYFSRPSFRAMPVIAEGGSAMVLDLGIGSRALGVDPAGLDVRHFGRLIEAAMADAGATRAYGRYAEPRALYRNEHFAGSDAGGARTVHMGIDVFCRAGTAVCAPLAGTVHLKADNARELDYGPVLVLRHHVAGRGDFFTLYGHLSPESLEIATGAEIDAGEAFAAVGSPPGNGNWPPHLHFQLILDLLDLGADFPGVAPAGERELWLALSPSPAAFFPECLPAELEFPGQSAAPIAR